MRNEMSNLQCVLLIPGQSSFYDMKSWYFDLQEIALKMMPRLWASGSNWIFNLSTFGQLWSRGFKTVGAQSLQRLGFERGSPEDQIYNSDFAKNVASNPNGLELFLIANFEGP